MRRSKQAAAQTRANIVTAAALQFRQNGIAETGIAEIMAAAGLTNGGFYRHFESKDELLAEASNQAFSSLLDKLAQRSAGKPPRKALLTLLSNYLSAEHLSDFSNACPLAALGTDLRRSGDKSRQIAATGFHRLVAMVAGQLPHLDRQQAKTHATAIVSAMVGSVILARIVQDPSLSQDILKSTTDFILQSGDLS